MTKTLVTPSLYLRLVAHIMALVLEQCCAPDLATDLLGVGIGLCTPKSCLEPLSLGLVLCFELCKFVVLIVASVTSQTVLYTVSRKKMCHFFPL